MIACCKDHWDESCIRIFSSFEGNLSKHVVPSVVTCVHVVIVSDVSTNHDEIDGVVLEYVCILLFAFRS